MPHRCRTGSVIAEADRAAGVVSSPWVSRSAAAVPLEHGDEFVAFVGDDIKAREMQPVLGCGDYARLMLPAERDDLIA